MVKYNIKCKKCGNERKVFRAINQPEPNYCSRVCYHTDPNNNKNLEGLKIGWSGKYGFKKGNVPWIKGKAKPKRYKNQDYITFYHKGKDKPYHRYIWEKHNGPIPKGHVIHHINHNKLDNRIENLQMMTREEHGKLHWKGTKKIKRNGI